MEQACGCSTVRGGGGVKVRARLCLWRFGGDGLPPRPSICRGGLVPLHWSRHQALTSERASLRLLHGARRRRRRSQGECSPLPLALRWRVLMKLCPLMEHARRCSTVRGTVGGGGKVRVRLCLWICLALWWRLLATKTKHLQRVSFIRTEAAIKRPTTDRGSLRLLHGM